MMRKGSIAIYIVFAAAASPNVAVDPQAVPLEHKQRCT
jgi:hypothetical protein